MTQANRYDDVMLYVRRSDILQMIPLKSSSRAAILQDLLASHELASSNLYTTTTTEQAGKAAVTRARAQRAQAG